MQLASKVAEHEAFVAKAKEETAALEAKVAKLSILKGKLEDEIAEGVEEAEKSMRGAESLEGKLRELQEDNADLQVDLNGERKAREEERSAWEKERATLKSEVETHVTQSTAHKESLDRSLASAETHATEVKVTENRAAGS